MLLHLSLVGWSEKGNCICTYNYICRSRRQGPRGSDEGSRKDINFVFSHCWGCSGNYFCWCHPHAAFCTCIGQSCESSDQLWLLPLFCLAAHCSLFLFLQTLQCSCAPDVSPTLRPHEENWNFCPSEYCCSCDKKALLEADEQTNQFNWPWLTPSWRSLRDLSFWMVFAK